MGKGFQESFVVWLLHYNVTTVLRMLTKLITLQQGWYSAVISSLILMRYLSNIHTWAIFFLRHLANMSSMVPSWAWTDSVWSNAVRKRLFTFLMTAAHISPDVFSLRNFLGNVHVLFLIIHSTSFILIIHHIRTSNYSFYYMTNSLFHFFGSS
jgi:hypothetical protein